MGRRRELTRYSSLTSLLDVLFILLFAALIHAAASVETARGASSEAPGMDAPSRDAGVEPELASRDAAPPSPTREQLYRQALAELAEAIEGRHVTFARISPRGVLVSLERDEPGEIEEMTRLDVGVPLLERVPDADRGVVYMGERIADLRICTVVRRHLGREDLEGELVIIVPEVPLAELGVALVRGLRRDQQRCMRDEGGVGVVVDPGRAADVPVGGRHEEAIP